MKIAEILHIAKLSRLKLTPEELANYPARFEGIMKMINVFGEVNTDGITPMHNPFDLSLGEADLREDALAKDSQRLILTSPEDPYFYVPKVIE
jgi:aspartyl-tRNA(Asn)/glutamyl-tRNA(Gln) amidotransferase subunit C